MRLKQQLGKRIKELRVKNHLTQEQLAELVDINTKHQSSIETGRHYPSAELIERYAKVFSMNSIEILYMVSIPDKDAMITAINDALVNLPEKEIIKIYKMLCL